MFPVFLIGIFTSSEHYYGLVNWFRGRSLTCLVLTHCGLFYVLLLERKHHKNGFSMLDLDYFSFVVRLGLTPCQMFYWLDFTSFYNFINFSSFCLKKILTTSDFSALFYVTLVNWYFLWLPCWPLNLPQTPNLPLYGHN